MDYLTLRVPVDTKEKMTSTTWTGEPPFQGSNGIYEQCGCKMIQVVPAAYADVREGIHLAVELRNRNALGSPLFLLGCIAISGERAI